jgi:restriction system protein
LVPLTKEARYEADRASVPIQLINLQRLHELVLEYDEQLAPEVRALIPQRVNWPEA